MHFGRQSAASNAAKIHGMGQAREVILNDYFIFAIPA
jgi:hypothetical protein